MDWNDRETTQSRSQIDIMKIHERRDISTSDTLHDTLGWAQNKIRQNESKSEDDKKRHEKDKLGWEITQEKMAREEGMRLDKRRDHEVGMENMHGSSHGNRHMNEFE